MGNRSLPRPYLTPALESTYSEYMNDAIKLGDKVTYYLNGARRTGYVRELHNGGSTAVAIVTLHAAGTISSCTTVPLRACTAVS